MCTINCIRSVWVEDYVHWSEDKLGYVIDIVNDNYVKIKEVIETIMSQDI